MTPDLFDVSMYSRANRFSEETISEQDNDKHFCLYTNETGVCKVEAAIDKLDAPVSHFPILANTDFLILREERSGDYNCLSYFLCFIYNGYYFESSVELDDEVTLFEMDNTFLEMEYLLDNATNAPSIRFMKKEDLAQFEKKELMELVQVLYAFIPIGMAFIRQDSYFLHHSRRIKILVSNPVISNNFCMRYDTFCKIVNGEAEPWNIHKPYSYLCDLDYSEYE